MSAEERRFVRTSLLKDQKLFRKFCQRRNKDYKCAEIFGCEHQVCPLAHANETEYLMNIKNLPLGEAYRLAERASPTKEWAQEILRQKLDEAAKIIQERRAKEKEDEKVTL